LLDAELLEMLATLLDEVELRDWNLQLNSVGCADDRARYNKALREALQPVVHQMCADCQRRAETNPLRVLDCKHPEDQPIIEKLPKISEYLDEPCREHFAAVRAMLDAVACRIPSTSAWCAGWTTTRAPRSNSRTAAWARRVQCSAAADTMVCPNRLRAEGAGHRLRDWRRSSDSRAAIAGRAAERKVAGVCGSAGRGMNAHAMKLARELRRAGVSADLGDEDFRLKKSFETAEKAGAKYIVIVGENELAADTFTVKNLASGEQVKVPRVQLVEYLRGRFQHSAFACAGESRFLMRLRKKSTLSRLQPS